MSAPRQLLDELAVPRLVGSAGHQRAHTVLASALAARGYAVERHRFRAPATRVRLVALAGGALALVGIAAAIRTLGGPRAGALALWAAGLTAAATLALLTAAWARRPPAPQGATLIATRGDAAPRVWLVAHYDAKGQGLSMLGRLVAVAASLGGAAALAAAGLAALAGAAVPAVLWLAAALPAAAGGYGLLAAGLRNDSPGAVDNATGVLAALETADALPPAAAVGLIFPDAEELGLVGARALARERPALVRDTALINLDGIDDRGPVVAFVHRPGPLVDAVIAALGARRARRLPVVVDGIVLGRVAREAVTILKGDLATMRVVHTRRDTAARLNLAGVDGVARALARALRDAEPRVDAPAPRL